MGMGAPSGLLFLKDLETREQHNTYIQQLQVCRHVGKKLQNLQLMVQIGDFLRHCPNFRSYKQSPFYVNSLHIE